MNNILTVCYKIRYTWGLCTNA